MKRYEMKTTRRNEAVSYLLTKEFDENSLCKEEAYLIVYDTVSYLYSSGQFISLNKNYELDDLAQEVYITLLRRGAFEKFDSKKSQKRTYITRLTKNVMIDMLRTLKEATTFSEVFTDTEEDDSKLIDNLLVDEKDFVKNLLQMHTTRDFLLGLDNTKGVLEGVNPFTKRRTVLTKRLLAEMLIFGYSIKEIQGWFINPKTNKPPTLTPLYSLAKKINNEAEIYFNII